MPQSSSPLVYNESDADEIASLRNFRDNLLADNASLTAENDRLNRQVEHYRDHGSRLQATNAILTEQALNLQAAEKNYSTAFDETQAEKAEMQEQVARLTAQAERVRDDIKDVDAAYRHWRKACNELVATDEPADYQHEIAELTAKVAGPESLLNRV
jgi:chromosome segregation ATPase